MEMEIHDRLEYLEIPLVILVLGASGDLAKKKTYPALFELYLRHYLPSSTIICGYARTKHNENDFLQMMKDILNKKCPEHENEVTSFINLCMYTSGNYDSPEDVKNAFQTITKSINMKKYDLSKGMNHLFYFAIPPNVFIDSARSIRQTGMSSTGWNRMIVEKPFGRDSESFENLSAALGSLFREDQIYRIDHYLGKEMVQNLLVLRFANAFFEPIWNRQHIQSVTITFKEDIGTDGRGGYFDSYGIIRDVIQNHLTQVLSLVAMEPPVRISGGHSGNFIRDEKVKVLQCIRPIDMNQTVIGQYVKSEKHPNGAKGYLDDPTVPRESITPTFATCVLYIDNYRWHGVPFILKAGKALDVRKGEVRVQFRQPPASDAIFQGSNIQKNDLVIRLQPEEAVYMKVNVKSPGLRTAPVSSELDLTYSARYNNRSLPDAYTRLILDVCRGQESTFVRQDELHESWRIFSPWLQEIEKQKIKPIPYEYGTRGPKEADELIKQVGYEFHDGWYQWNEPFTKSKI